MEDEDLIACIYAGVTAPDWLEEILKAIGDRVGASSAALFSTHSRKQPNARLTLQNIDPAMLTGWQSHWHTQDIWAESAVRANTTRSGTVGLADELLPRSAVLASDYYNGPLKAYVLERLLGAIVFDDEGDEPLTHICWYRTQKDPSFQHEDKRLVQRLLPHIQEACRLRSRIARLENDLNESSAALEASRCAAIRIDSHGRVIASNALGMSVLQGRHGPILRLRSGRIAGVGARSAPAWEEALALADSGRCGSWRSSHPAT